MELKQSYKVEAEDQRKFNELNSQLPFRTSTYILYNENNEINVMGEKVDPITEEVDGVEKETGLNEPTGSVKAKFDTLDDRTLKGCNWDKK